MNRAQSKDPHPLQAFVMQEFSEWKAQDVTTLSVSMAGCMSLTDTKGKNCMKAYRTVAQDVLGYMEDQGIVFRDMVGWYRLNDVGVE